MLACFMNVCGGMLGDVAILRREREREDLERDRDERRDLERRRLKLRVTKLQIHYPRKHAFAIWKNRQVGC